MRGVDDVRKGLQVRISTVLPPLSVVCQPYTTRAQVWVDSLADHLRYSEANLEKQVDMFETSSNTGAWAFCFMHVLHPCLVLSMTEVSSPSRQQLTTPAEPCGCCFP